MFQGKDPNTEMNFLDHLEALRWHLVRSAAAVVILAVVAFLYPEILFDKIILGPKDPHFPTYRALCWLAQQSGVDFCIDKIPFTLINIDISGQFTTHLYVSFMAGFVIAFPYFVWEIWRFVKPALSPTEKSNSRGIVLSVSFLFLLGVLFGYYVVAPLSINFLGSYQISEQVSNNIGLGSFISTVTTLAFASGIVFELPVAIYFLSKLGLVSPPFLRKYRRHAMVIILIVAAVITPSPDVTSQVLVAIPLFLLYELGIGVSAAVERNRNKNA
jgi:sec-independent protein translocase protein TatC